MPKRLLRYLTVIHTWISIITSRGLFTQVNKARDIQHSDACSDLRVLQIGTRAKVIENQGADDEEVSEGGIPRVIILGYDGHPIQPVAPPSPDYIPGPKDRQTPPVPQDEDDETEDGPVDYHMDGGDDGDDEDGDSSRDDANDEDEDEEDEEEEEEHLAPTDSTTVIPVDEPVFPPEGTEPVIPPPSTDITIGARITVRPQTSISLPPEAEGSALLVTAALPPPPLPPLPPSLYIPPPVDRKNDIPESEQPPRKRLYLSTIGFRYEIGESSTVRPTRGRGVDPAEAVPEIAHMTVGEVNTRVTELAELHERQSWYSSDAVRGSRYKVGESSTARPTRGQGIDYGFVSTVDAEERRQGIRDVGYGIRDTWVDPAEAVPEIAHMTVGEVNTRVVELVELHERDTQDLYALLEDAQDDSMVWWRRRLYACTRRGWAHSIGLSQATHQELQTHRDHVYAHETHLQAHQTQLQLPEYSLFQTPANQRTSWFRDSGSIRDMRQEMSDMQAELLALREQRRRARQPGPEARISDHQDASGDADSHI
ncbi:hypothetical protein Tco_0046196 [Tanacetum coccineum]